MTDVDMLNDNMRLLHDTLLKLPDQCRQAFAEARKLYIPADYECFRAVVVCGMGWSAIGPEIVGDVFGRNMKMPYLVNRDYLLPFKIDEEVLVILSSYSGNTEEVLACGEEACRRRAKVLAITTGGRLGKWASKNHLPCYRIQPDNNPSGQPRLGIGYSVMGLVGLISRLGIAQYQEKQVADLSAHLELQMAALDAQAKEYAQKMAEKFVIIVGAGHLRGAARSVSYALNENSKAFSVFFELPELNHYLLEGLTFPKNFAENTAALFLNSDNFSPEIKTRLMLTKKVFEQKGYSTLEYVSLSDDKLTQALEVILLGLFTSEELARFYQVDPIEVPQIEEFKKRLKKEVKTQ